MIDLREGGGDGNQERLNSRSAFGVGPYRMNRILPEGQRGGNGDLPDS